MQSRNKFLFFALFLFFFTPNAEAQVDISSTRSRLGLGLNGGVTIGDYDGVYSSNIGLDVVYLYGLSARFHVGVATGFANYFYKEDESHPELRGEMEDFRLIPITASIRVSPIRNLLGGADIGYALNLDGNRESGFYASPRLTYLFAGRVPDFVGYRTINLNKNLDSVQFGIGLILK
ncbi:MAG: hypothetical protein AAGA66_11680 [Bacteroidota bacterium]